MSLRTGTKSHSDLDLGSLRVFVAIVESGSFVAGGKALGLTRSAAGKAIARLEAQLETRLFHRTTRSVALTRDGYGFYERCAQILQDSEEAEASVRQNFSSPGGVLRLSVPETWGKVVLLPFLKHFMAAYPRLDIEVNFTDRVVDLVAEGFDLSLRLGDLPKDSQLIARTVQRIRPHLFASPDYLASSGIPGSPEDLRLHQRLIYGLSPQTTNWTLFTASNESVLVEGHSRIRFDSGEAICAAAVAGLGIAFLPAFLVARDVAEGTLVPVLSELGGTPLTVNVVYPNRKHLAAKVRLFIDSLVKHMDH
ncbi:LysR family transcriptional regulator [Enterobacter sp. Ap-916]|uniref:LysR family transcriptional regulator n=1 Tax=unclassified Enterobacter TaxID=2608935 RepID=UPI001421113E|nr:MULTISPECIES: LysR family transcriptional regulator [unclassified Enterobacter]NIF59116.1 LysR family transcriptional regulator [Enterobacter sp. Ap-867]NIG29468.1 LysR family transcriptional regulator [Enterobacter sp. Ap-916]